MLPIKYFTFFVFVFISYENIQNLLTPVYKISGLTCGSGILAAVDNCDAVVEMFTHFWREISFLTPEWRNLLAARNIFSFWTSTIEKFD